MAVPADAQAGQMGQSGPDALAAATGRSREVGRERGQSRVGILRDDAGEDKHRTGQYANDTAAAPVVSRKRCGGACFACGWAGRCFTLQVSSLGDGHTSSSGLSRCNGAGRTYGWARRYFTLQVLYPGERQTSSPGVARSDGTGSTYGWAR